MRCPKSPRKGGVHANPLRPRSLHSNTVLSPHSSSPLYRLSFKRIRAGSSFLLSKFHRCPSPTEGRHSVPQPCSLPPPLTGTLISAHPPWVPSSAPGLGPLCGANQLSSPPLGQRLLFHNRGYYSSHLPCLPPQLTFKLIKTLLSFPLIGILHSHFHFPIICFPFLLIKGNYLQ